MTTLRIASWNLCYAEPDCARRLGDLLSDSGGADIVALQEARPDSMDSFCGAAELDWWIHLGVAFPDLLEARGRAGGPREVAIAGRGQTATSPAAFPDLALPEKALAAWVRVDGRPVTIVSYHAPAGSTHGPLKADQAVQIAEWLAHVEGPAVMAGDFNAPSDADPPDPAGLRTGWHTGHRRLEGKPGDDLLIGAHPVHPLRDLYRVWLSNNPAELQRIVEQRPDGPLAVTHRTGRTDRRYDAIWATSHFRPTRVEHRFEEAVSAGTDHALVVADLVVDADKWASL